MSVRGNSTGGSDLTATPSSVEDDVGTDPWIGKALGKYRIISRLGRGGMGVVYEAFDPILQRTVAIKILRDGLNTQPNSVRKFLREARTAAKLNNPRVVAVYDADEEKGTAYLVMELMEGGSADDRIRKWGPFDWVEATQVLADACQGLVAVHSAGLIHRDIKPSNIMRALDGTVKLADFGLALTFEGPGDSSNRQGHVVGTPLYMSPEQCRGEKLDPRSDIYSLGATYYTLLTGTPPFVGKSSMDVMLGHCSRSIPDPCAANSFLPAACSELIRRMMAKDPGQRPEDANALLKDFQAILALATNPDIHPLEWATSASEKIAATPIPGILSTAIEPIAPVYLTTRRPRTRAWFVGTCLILMGLAYVLGRHFSASVPTQPPPAAAETPAPVESRQLPVASVPSKKDSAEVVIDAIGDVTALAFNPDDPTQIFSGTHKGEQKVHLWPAGKQSHKIGLSIRSPILEASYWKQNSDRCWVSVFDGKLHFYDVVNLQPAHDQGSWCSVDGKRIDLVAVHPKEKLLALAVHDVAGATGGIVLRSLSEAGADDDFKQTEDKQPPTCLAFSTDGSYLLMSGQQNRSVKIWKLEQVQLANGAPRFVLRGGGNTTIGRGPVICMAALDTTRFAVAVGGQVWLCDASTGSTVSDDSSVRNPIHDGPTTIAALAVSAKRKRIAYATGKSVRIFDCETQQQVDEMTDYPEQLNVLAFDSDGKWLATGGAHGKIVVRPVK